MHVALVDPSGFSPPYDVALARGLAASGQLVTLVGAVDGPLARTAGLDHLGHFYRPLATPLGRRLPARAGRLAKGLLHAFDLWRLPLLLRHRKVDVVHLQWAPLPLLDLALLDRLRTVAPVVFTVHDTVPFNGAEPWLMAAGIDRLTRRADAVICHTEQGRRRLLRKGVASARLHVVPHGLLGRRIDLVPPSSPRIRLLQLGKIKPYKGIPVLLRALGLLGRVERQGLAVEIVGQPHQATEPLTRLAAELGLGDCVRFDFGFVAESRMDELLAAADALVFPYLDIEASGVLMQAVAAGLPVVASRIGVFAELLEHGRQGLLVPAGDPESLAAALRRLLAAPASLTEMRIEMCKLRDRLPGWDAIGHQTSVVYAAAASGWAGSRPDRSTPLRESAT